MNPKLQAAVAIFKELGWEKVTSKNVLQLPLGTPEQKRTALEGLKSGEWGELVETRSRDLYQLRSHFDVDECKLAIFAVRVGVTAQRAANILDFKDNEMLISAIADRGAKYALDFIRHACVSSRRWSEHGVSVFGPVVVRLVDGLNLDIPQNVEYMKDWSFYAATAMGLKEEALYKETGLPTLGLIEKRFAEHVQTGVAVGVPAAGPFGSVLPEGVKRGWFPRDKAVQMVFSALDASVRPRDRRAWLVALDKLSITDDELSERAQSLIPLLASGDAIVVSRLAPPLIAKATDGLLSEVLLASFSVTTKSARLLILKAAQGRPCPKNAEEIAPWLSILAGDKDRALAAQAAKLIQQWGLGVEKMSDEATEVQGLWQKTPPVWQPPPFELGDVTPDALTELAARLVNQPDVISDVNSERFLALANALAHKDPEAARTALRGLYHLGDLLLYHMVNWVKGLEPHLGNDTRGFVRDSLTARDYVVALHLGKLPCLLSTPSRIDLTVSVTDLAARLALYKETGKGALEADLLLALTRIDPMTVTPDAVEALRGLDVPIVLQSGKKMPIKAGMAVLAYLDDPMIEAPGQLNDQAPHRPPAKINVPNSLALFPNRFCFIGLDYMSAFPLWGDSALLAVRWGEGAYKQKGLVLRQAARRAAPLPPGASINFLAAQRSHTPEAAEDAMLAVTEAWARGLLRPGVADVAFLDWSSGPPSHLAALATALDGIAREGMLSVVWPVLDRLIQASVKAPRLLAGTAELAELALAFLPEVQAAVEVGLTDKTALDLPGIGALAQLGGSSKAVTAAKSIAAQLKAMQGARENGKTAKPAMETPFEDVWPKRETEAPLIEDGVTMTVGLAYPDSKHTALKTTLLFVLTLPGITERVFHVVMQHWGSDMCTEGQCPVRAAGPGATVYAPDKGGKNNAWLHWDAEKGAMVVTKHRNWGQGKPGTLDRELRTPLSLSLLTVAVGLLAQDGDAVDFAPRLFKFIDEGQIDQNIVRRAAQTLLQHPAVNPAKLVRALEKDVKLLPVMWPMLTESIKAAGTVAKAGENPPAWVNRILDSALRYAPYLAEAAKRGLMPKDDAKWHGLAEIASSKAKSTAVAKAKKLMEIVG